MNAPSPSNPTALQAKTTRAEISKMLSGIAGILLAGAFTFSVFAIEKTEPTKIFWIFLLISLLLIIVSVFASGFGMDVDLRSSAEASNWYQVQALALLLGIIFLAASLIFTSPAEQAPPPRDARVDLLQTLLAQNNEKLKSTEARITNLETELKRHQLPAHDKNNSADSTPCRRPAQRKQQQTCTSANRSN